MGVGDIHRMNAVKTFLAAAINTASVVVFVRDGLVNWDYAWPMVVAAIVGGYAGARVARRLPASYVRYAVIVIGFGLSAFYFIRQYATEDAATAQHGDAIERCRFGQPRPEQHPREHPDRHPGEARATAAVMLAVWNCAAHHPPASMPSTMPTFPPVNMARAWRPPRQRPAAEPEHRGVRGREHPDPHPRLHQPRASRRRTRNTRRRAAGRSRCRPTSRGACRGCRA